MDVPASWVSMRWLLRERTCSLPRRRPEIFLAPPEIPRRALVPLWQEPYIKEGSSGRGWERVGKEREINFFAREFGVGKWGSIYIQFFLFGVEGCFGMGSSTVQVIRTCLSYVCLGQLDQCTC